MINSQSKKLVQALISSFAVSGCITYVNSSDFERTFNSKVGTKIIVPMYLQDGWNKINEDESSFELEFINKNGCSYAYKIDKFSDTILSWKFTSDKSKCDNTYVQGA